MDGNEQQAHHHVKHVQLPSGKMIEVIHFGDVVEQGGELHLCRGCGSELVHPTYWSEAGKSSWEVTLRCPECEEIRAGTFDQEAVDAFDEQLDLGTDALAHDLARLTHANMAEEARRFVAALAVDAILPEDF
ncbi:MAG: hypothetical protein ACR2FZ_03985 [Thermoleophilaceae bacterium]